MLRFLRTTLIGLAVLVLIAAGATYFLLQDPNRFKPQLEAVIYEQGGVPVTIDGDLSWRLWPPVSLSAEQVQADHQGQAWQIGRLTVELDAWNAVRDPRHWQIQSLAVADVTMEEKGSVLQVAEARLSDLAPNRPAPLQAQLSYQAAPDMPARPVSLDGTVTVDPESLRIAFAGTRIETSDAAGTCDLDAQPVANPVPAPPATPEDLIPVDVFRSYTWQGQCLLDWLELDGQRFEQVTVDLANDAGASTVAVAVPRFFGGNARADIAVDASVAPVRWTVTPTLSGVDSAALMDWLDQDLAWAAPLAYGGTLRAAGNTEQALLASLSGETRFDGGQGRIDISQIRTPLINLASMINSAERIKGWPEMWQYQHFVGTWRIDNQHHVLDAALDNLNLTGQGDYRPASQELDMRFELMFTNNPQLPVFDMDPVLYDLPIPVRCQGVIGAPECRVDATAAQRIVAQALGSENSELRGKLEKKIDQDVPEEYRDAARALLDAFSNSSRQPPRDP